jgi:UDP-GlcNAc:undecaprenyl-phosphate/decaprenyl-phosphate GlcNAc-1-phosphate transferase
MTDLAFIPAFLLAATVTFIAVVPVISLARRTDFYDHPVGYKQHGAATPYLGGLAVFAGFAVSGLIFGDLASRYWVLFACAGALLVLGTLDDRFPMAPRWRVLAEIGTAVALDAAGLGWTIFGPEVLNLLLTIVWVVGLCNAFNLMDNLDGAAGTVAGVSATGVGVVALTYDDPVLAALAFSLAGACAGFLPHNLAGPARIFLGDGGSLPIGFLVAGMAMVACDGVALGAAAVPYAALLTGLAIFDTLLVVVSRRRARVPVALAGRDHLTHRLFSRLASERRVALALALLQSWLALGAIMAAEVGRAALALVALVAFVCGLVAVGVLESSRWRPARPVMSPLSQHAPRSRTRYETAAPSGESG